MNKLAVICLVVPILVLLAYACERMWCANKKINAAYRDTKDKSCKTF